MASGCSLAVGTRSHGFIPGNSTVHNDENDSVARQSCEKWHRHPIGGPRIAARHAAAYDTGMPAAKLAVSGSAQTFGAATHGVRPANGAWSADAHHLLHHVPALRADVAASWAPSTHNLLLPPCRRLPPLSSSLPHRRLASQGARFGGVPRMAGGHAGPASVEGGQAGAAVRRRRGHRRRLPVLAAAAGRRRGVPQHRHPGDGGERTKEGGVAVSPGLCLTCNHADGASAALQRAMRAH